MPTRWEHLMQFNMQPEIHDVRKTSITYKATLSWRNYIISFLTVIKNFIVIQQLAAMVNIRLGSHENFYT